MQNLFLEINLYFWNVNYKLSFAHAYETVSSLFLQGTEKGVSWRREKLKILLGCNTTSAGVIRNVVSSSNPYIKNILLILTYPDLSQDVAVKYRIYQTFVTKYDGYAANYLANVAAYVSKS